MQITLPSDSISDGFLLITGTGTSIERVSLWGVPSKRRKEKTPKGLEVPVPTKGEFDAAMRKVAPPVGRKRPDEKDRPQKQSE